MASITKRGKGYQIRISLGKDINGKRTSLNETYYPKAKKETVRLKEATEYANELERRIKTGDYYRGENITLNDFFIEWRENYAYNYLTIALVEEYCRTMERCFLTPLGFMDISKITPLQLQKIETDLEKKQGLMPKTIKKYFSALSTIMNKAYRLGLIRENPCRRVEFPKIKKDYSVFHTFTESEAKLFLRALDMEYKIPFKAHKRTLKSTGEAYSVPQYNQSMYIGTLWKAYFTLALFSGARKGELLALTWSDLDFITNTIHITKACAKTKSKGQIIKEPKSNAGKRSFTLPLTVFTVLQEWKEEQKQNALNLGTKWLGYSLNNFDDNFIFTQDNGRQMDLTSPSHKFNSILDMYNNSVNDESLKLPKIKLHDLRHCMASILVANGTDIATVSKRLGHADISITLNTYTHALKDRDNSASEILGKVLELEEDAQISALQS